MKLQGLIQAHDDADVLSVQPGDVAQEDLVALLQQRAMIVFDVAQKLHNPARAVEVGGVHGLQEIIRPVQEGIPESGGHQGRHADHQRRKNSRKHSIVNNTHNYCPYSKWNVLESGDSPCVINGRQPLIHNMGDVAHKGAVLKVLITETNGKLGKGRHGKSAINDSISATTILFLCVSYQFLKNIF